MGITDIAWNQYSDTSFTSVGEDCDIIVWDTRSFEPSIIEKESICPLSISYNPLKEFEFVIGKEDGSIVIKDERKLNESIYTTSLHQDAIYSVSWTTNDYICSGGDDGVLSICDNSLKSIFKSEATSSFIRTTYWNNHSSTLYTADWNGK